MQFCKGFQDYVPHNKMLGIEALECQPEEAFTRLPYRRDWLADKNRELIHTGLITTLFDSSAGLAVFAAVGITKRIATLDLRVDYLRPAFAPHDLYCRASCFRLASRIAFVSGQIYQQDQERPVAVCRATFMHTDVHRKQAHKGSQ